MGEKKQEKSQIRTVSCGERKIIYTLTRKGVKNINIRVKEDGKVLVSANRRVSCAYLDELIRSKQTFILQALDRYEDLRRKREEAERLGQYLNGGKKENFTEEILYQICQEIYPLFEPYGVSYPQIKLRRMKSQWGSCRPRSGIITLNRRLIEVPRKSIEYVVLHEFVHFIHPDHSRDFYAMVESMMPDWRERKRLLEGAI